MVKVKLLGRVKYQDTLYSANEKISVNEETAEYLKGKNLCEVLVEEKPVEVIEKVAEPKKGKKAK